MTKMPKIPKVLAVPTTAFSLELIVFAVVDDVVIGLVECVKVGCWDDDRCVPLSD